MKGIYKMKFKPAFTIEENDSMLKTEVSFWHTTIKECQKENRLIYNSHLPHDLPDRRITVCTVRYTDSDNEIHECLGIAICHPKDNFNKYKARIKSLTKALYGWEREETTQVWWAYWKWINSTKKRKAKFQKEYEVLLLSQSEMSKNEDLNETEKKYRKKIIQCAQEIVNDYGYELID